MFIVLSLFIAYLFLLGCGAGVFRAARGRLAEQVALAIAVGILLNDALTLTGLKLSAVLGVGSAIGAWGLVRLVREIKVPRPYRMPESRTIVLGCALAYVLVVYYFQILSEPLLRWDARSVWFFHAKMIWTAGAFRQTTGWDHPSVAFASPDYPNLVPAVAAQLALIKGHWNEFLPKGSLLVMLVPLVLWVFSFARRGLSFPLLVALFFFSLDGWLWNGYMDGYLTMYCGVALLMFGRYAQHKRETDLYAAISALGIAAATKNEGLLFAVCAVVGVLLVGTRRDELGLPELLKGLRTDRVFVSVGLIAATPTILWTVLKRLWGLENHVIGVSGTLERLSSRLVDGVTPQYLLQFLATRATVAWLLLALIVIAALFSRYQRIKLHPGAIVAFTTTALYFCGMYLVYLITPANLTWHLLTSATRVMATVSFGLLIAIVFLLSGLEASESAEPIAPPADLAAVRTASRSAR